MSDDIIELSSEDSFENIDGNKKVNLDTSFGSVHSISSSEDSSNDYTSFKKSNPIKLSESKYSSNIESHSISSSSEESNITTATHKEKTKKFSISSSQSSDELTSPYKVDGLKSINKKSKTIQRRKEYRTSKSTIESTELNDSPLKKVSDNIFNPFSDFPSSSKNCYKKVINSDDEVVYESEDTKYLRALEINEGSHTKDKNGGTHSISASDQSDSNVSSVSLPSPCSNKKRRKKIIKEDDTNEKLRKNKEKQKRTEERLKKKKEEADMKEKKKQVADSLRKFKPGECLKHLTTKLDSALLQEPYGKDIITSLDNLNTKYEFINQPLPCTITWLRDSNNGEEEDILIVIWSGDKFINLVAENNFINEINKLKKVFHDKRTVLIVYGFEYSMKKLQKEKCSKKNKLSEELKILTKTNIKLAMVEIQLECNCNCKLLETRADIALHISQVTKSVSEIPFRLEKQKLEEKSDWHATSDNKGCVKVDKLGNGLARLWKQQLCQFNNVSLDMSEAIINIYKTPTALSKAYEVCNSRREGERLLADIKFRRGRGPSSTTRPIGIELSKKIYYLFNSTDPDTPLSQVLE